MPEQDKHFIMPDEDPHHTFDPAGFKKANVGATRGGNLAAIKVGVVLVLALLGWWVARSALSGAAFEVEGRTLSVPSQGWETTLPEGWTAERGTNKREIVAYPESAGDVRAATRASTIVRITHGDDGDATTTFKDAHEKTRGRNATFSDLVLPAGAAVRAEEPADGRVSVFVDGDPSLMVVAPKPSLALETILSSLRRTAR